MLNLNIAEIAGKARPLAPGLTIAALVGIAASFFQDHYGVPVFLMALLLGMTLNFLMENQDIRPGIDFASKTLLRVGVALLGFRISFGDISALGWQTVLMIICFIALTIGSGFVFSKLLSRGWRFALLTGGAVAICGASAALAIAAVIPKNDRMEHNTLFTIMSVTILSTVAMIFYPIFFAWLGFTDEQSGFLIGATIHDVAQVVGAGYSISDSAGDTATVVKLMRVACLPLVLLCILYFTRTDDLKGQAKLPFFMIAFMVFVLINSLLTLPQEIKDGAGFLSRTLLIIAISALGVKTSLKQITEVGFGHFAVVVGETLFLLVMATLVVMVFV